MADRILVCVAWPYANYLLHVGQAAGAYVPADIFARYHRVAGNDVLMVSGSDSHGTPITVAADEQGVTPEEIVSRYHPKILEVWERLGISFDNYTTTLTPNHYEVTQDIFLRLLEKDYLYRAEQEQLYDPEAERFLPDRYVLGTCPKCGYEEARGDQCDNCGRTLDAVELLNPRSKMTGATPILRSTEHYFLRLSAFNDRLKEWITPQAHWRLNVRNFSLGMLNEGLHDRAITRDIAWGVPVPVEGWDNKRIYVWFDAVIGYLSSSKEWAQKQGDEDAWRPYWEDPATKSFYFIGKDNIPFHTLIWPAMLMGYGGLNLAYDVPANQYIIVESGAKQSKSAGTGTWVLNLLDTYDPDVVRFYLAQIMPETSDTVYREEDMIRANNDILIGTWGNLVNRAMTIISRNFDGMVPEPGELSPESAELMAKAEAAFPAVGAEYEAVHFRAALQEALRVAQAANAYINNREPWKAVKQDRTHAAETLYVAINAVNALRTLLYPILPFSCQQLHEMLGLPGRVEDGGWQFAPLSAGTPLGQPQPLYRKLELPESDGA